MTEAQQDTIASYDETAEEFSKTIGKLTNYNHTYDFLIEKLCDDSTILDLACGPAQISAYIKKQKNVSVTGVDLSEKMLELAKKAVPDGVFYRHSIIDFNIGQLYDAVIIGFGLPYLDGEQAAHCIKTAAKQLVPGGYLYVSFMQGRVSGSEKTSFGSDRDFLVQYHDRETITEIFQSCGLKIAASYELDYAERDGSHTKDIVLVGNTGYPLKTAFGNF